MELKQELPAPDGLREMRERRDVLTIRLKIVGADVRRLFALVGSEEKSKPPDVGSCNEKHLRHALRGRIEKLICHITWAV